MFDPVNEIKNSITHSVEVASNATTNSPMVIYMTAVTCILCLFAISSFLLRFSGRWVSLQQRKKPRRWTKSAIGMAIICIAAIPVIAYGNHMKGHTQTAVIQCGIPPLSFLCYFTAISMRKFGYELLEIFKNPKPMIISALILCSTLLSYIIYKQGNTQLAAMLIIAIPTIYVLFKCVESMKQDIAILKEGIKTFKERFQTLEEE